MLKFKKNKSEINVHSPVSGTLVVLDHVNDEVFSLRMMGNGIAIFPTDNTIKSPLDATVKFIFPSKHAIGLICENGAELIIHIGLDTVNLNGKYFAAHVKEGKKVRKGDPLVTVDFQEIQKLNYDIVTPIICTNISDYSIEMQSSEIAVSDGDLIFTLRKL
jgi:glucose-specific phosphotransferase system IIA component